MPLQVPLGKDMLTLLKYCGFGKLKFKVNTKVYLILEKAALSVEEKKKYGFVGFKVWCDKTNHFFAIYFCHTWHIHEVEPGYFLIHVTVVKQHYCMSHNASLKVWNVCVCGSCC